jgi:hypothetical protein
MTTILNHVASNTSGKFDINFNLYPMSYNMNNRYRVVNGHHRKEDTFLMDGKFQPKLVQALCVMRITSIGRN